MLDQPDLNRHRLTVVPAGVTQKHPGHERNFARVEPSLVRNRLLESTLVNPERPAQATGRCGSRGSKLLGGPVCGDNRTWQR
jgi:hypothetical protein